jgi:hypothetical protein
MHPRGLPSSMTEERLTRAEKLKVAYETYYQLLTRLASPGVRDLTHFESIVSDAEARSKIALQMALEEIGRPA